MSTLSDLKARFFAAVTGKRNRTDAEMAYYGLAAAGAIPIVDPDGLETGDTLSWDADEESWVAGPGGGGGGAVDSVNGKTGVVVLDAADVSAVAEGAGLIQASGNHLELKATGANPATLGLDAQFGEAALSGRFVILGDASGGEGVVSLLAQLKLLNAEPSDFSTTETGSVFYHTGLNKPVYFDGTDWCTFDGAPIS